MSAKPETRTLYRPVGPEELELIEEKVVGDATHRELWIPAEELEEFNRRIVGRIELVRSFG